MNTTLLHTLNVSLLAMTLSAGLALPAPGTMAQSAPADKSAPAATEDILHLNTGQALRGKVISESRTEVVFEYHDPATNMKARIPFTRDRIVKLERNVPVAKPAEAAPADATGEDIAEEASAPAVSSNAPVTKVVDMARDYGISRVTNSDPNVPSVYIVPIRGQMGTDVRAYVYQDIIKDIREKKPSVVVLDVDCADSSEWMFPGGYDVMTEDPEKKEDRERSLLDFDDYRQFVSMFRDHLDVPQVVWIHDSDGISGTVMMAWDQIYMAPGARLGSKIAVIDRTGATGWADPDIRAKMIAASLSIAKSFVEKGGYSHALADAMLTRQAMLSGRWRGREVIWSLDDSGDYVVDESDEHTATFTAKSAEDFCITKGTVETIDDLSLMLGYREYRLIEGRQFDIINGYINGWRRAYENSKKWLRDVDQHLNWASGPDAVRYVGRALKDLENILRAIDQYKAVEIRLQMEFGITRVAVLNQIERLREQLRELRRNRGAGGVGGGGGGGRGGFGGGGGAD